MMWRLRVLIGLYWFGILGAIVLASVPLVSDAGLDPSHLILPFSVGHVLLLAAVGFTVAPPRNADAGERVQTAGYLHTLIGFSAALLLLDGQERTGPLDLTSFLLPVGSALLTSIVGWFLGGEITARGASEGAQSLEEEAGRAARELRAATDALLQLHEHQREVLEGVAAFVGLLPGSLETLSALQQQAADLQRQIERVSQAVAGALGESFAEALTGIHQGSARTASALQSTADAAVATTLRFEEVGTATSGLRDEMDRFSEAARSGHQSYTAGLSESAEVLSKLRQHHIQALRSAVGAVAGMNRAVEPLTGAVQLLREQISGVAAGVERHLGAEFQLSLAGLREEAAGAREQMHAVAEQARDTAEYLEQSRKLYEEVERIFAALSPAEP